MARHEVGAAIARIREAIGGAQLRGRPKRSLRSRCARGRDRAHSRAGGRRRRGGGCASAAVASARHRRRRLIGTSLVQRLIVSRLRGRRGRPARRRTANRPGHPLADSRSVRRVRHSSRRPRLPAHVHRLSGDADRPCPHSRRAASDARGRAGRDSLTPRPRRRDRYQPVRPGRQLARVRTARSPFVRTIHSSRARFEERSRQPPRCSAFSVRAPATSLQSSSGRSRSTARRSATAGSSPTALRAALEAASWRSPQGRRPRFRLRRRRRRRDRRGAHGRRRAERSRDQSRHRDRDGEQRARAARRARHRPASRARAAFPIHPARRTRTTGGRPVRRASRARLDGSATDLPSGLGGTRGTSRRRSVSATTPELQRRRAGVPEPAVARRARGESFAWLWRPSAPTSSSSSTTPARTARAS